MKHLKYLGSYPSVLMDSEAPETGRYVKYAEEDVVKLKFFNNEQEAAEWVSQTFPEKLTSKEGI